MEKANKALRTLVTMTILLAVMFTPVFQSYKSKEAKQIETIEYELSVAKTAKSKSKLETLTGDQIAIYTKALDAKQSQLELLKKDIERERMMWLSGALLVVVGGLLFSYASAKKKAEEIASKRGYFAFQEKINTK